MKSDLQPLPRDDAWLETLLSEQRLEYIDDAGFTARIVGVLPRRNLRRPWLLAIATVLGCAIAAGLGSTAYFRAITAIGEGLARQINSHPMVPAYALLGATLLFAAGSAWWALARRN